MIGQQVRHYRIDEQIGAGGMGVVYRATDLHLDRLVAIKVLPAHLVSSPERKKRFVQEAKAASALNHPNIVTIYDVDAAEVDGHTIAFIAMEYIAGDTLDRIVARNPGGVKLKEALAWAIQLCGALAAAHSGGIVHRDLKPSNVIITPEGLAKLLDFGLAKATEPAPQNVDASAATEEIALSQLAALTEEGTIVGTVNYMSPEQAEAKRVDPRSDIFSLGAVLYELFAGRRAFQAGSKIATLSAILHKDPPPLAEVPDALDRMIQRCLRKEPDRRWQHVSDLRIALEEIRDELATIPSRPAAVLPAPSGITRRRALSMAAGGVALAAAAGAWLATSTTRRKPVTFTRLTYRRGDVDAARFAPDGSVIYSANWEGSPYSVYSLRPGNRESRPLGLGQDVHLAAVSSTNELAIMLAPKGTLARVPVSGGAPRELLEDAIEADWSPDARQLAVVRRAGGGVFRLEYPVGKVLHETARQPMRPRIAPNARDVAFFELEPGVGDVALRVVREGAPARMLANGMRAVAGLAWARSGKEVWISAIRSASDNPAIFAVTLDGQLRQLTQGANWLSIHDVSPGGELLVASTISRVGIRGRLPGETETRDLSWHENSVISEITPDGAILMMELGAGEGRNNAIYYQRPGESVVRLGDGNYPALSPDGRSVVCVLREQNRTLLQIIPTGPGEVRRFPGEGFRYQAPEWFSDGKRILFNASKDGGPPRAYSVSLVGGPSTALTAPGVRAFDVSPNGQWLIASAGGKPPWLHSLAQPAEQRQIPGLEPAEVILGWTESSGGLLVRSPQAGGHRIRVDRLALASGVRERLFEVSVPEPGDVFRREFAITRDGRAFAFSFQRDLASLYLISGAGQV